MKALSMTIVLLAACGRDEAVIFEPEVMVTQSLSSQPESSSNLKPMKKVEIAVGGCRAYCRDPNSAAAFLLDATARGDVPSIISFLDTTRLIIDDEELGARWARMWNELMHESRALEIRATAERMSEWTKGLQPDQIRLVTTAGPRTLKLWSTEAVFEYDLPGHSSPWRIVFRPRGIEWLVTKITGLSWR